MIVLGLLLTSVIGSATAPLNVTVKYDHTVYRLETEPGGLKYRGGITTFHVPTPRCPAPRFTTVASTFEKLERRHAREKRAPAANYDVVVSEKGRRPLSVARGSVFGTWLRDLPKAIMYLDVEARTQCRR